MRTTKPISTISYNSVDYLIGKLNELVSSEVVSFWAFVCHDGEMLDNGKIQTQEKDHIHLYIEPNEKVDTVKLQKFSEEYDKTNPDKPLKCIHFRHSEWVDWLWYGMHDSDYLAMKMEERAYAYPLDSDAWYYSDADEFAERCSQALHDSEVFRDMKLKSMLKTHTVSEMAYMGMIKPSNANSYYAFERLYRTGADERINGEKERMKQLAEDIALDSPTPRVSGTPRYFSSGKGSEFFCNGTSMVDIPFQNFSDMNGFHE